MQQRFSATHLQTPVQTQIAHPFGHALHIVRIPDVQRREAKVLHEVLEHAVLAGGGQANQRDKHDGGALCE